MYFKDGQLDVSLHCLLEINVNLVIFPYSAYEPNISPEVPTTITLTENQTITVIETSTKTATATSTTTELTERTVTVTTNHMYSDSDVCFQSCADPSPTNTSTSTDRLQTRSTFGVGAVIAAVLGVILLVQLIACTLAWVVCLKMKQSRVKGDGIGKYKLCHNGILQGNTL